MDVWVREDGMRNNWWRGTLFRFIPLGVLQFISLNKETCHMIAFGSMAFLWTVIISSASLFFFYSDAHHIHIIPPHLWLCLLSADAFATATVVHILRVFVSLMQLLVSVTHLFEPKVYVTWLNLAANTNPESDFAASFMNSRSVYLCVRWNSPFMSNKLDKCHWNFYQV